LGNKQATKEIRAAWIGHVLGDGGPRCPVCAAEPMLRRYTFTETMALAMIFLRNNREKTVIQLPEDFTTGDSLVKLRLWGYVNDSLSIELTGRGEAAVKLMRKIPRTCQTINGRPVAFSTEAKRLNEYLSQKYDYDQLMGGA
jgi:hypothetical protein